MTLLVRDSYGNPVDRQEVVAWEGVDPADVFAPSAYTTNAAGLVTATLASRKAGQRSVKAVLSVGDKKRSADCTLNFKAPDVSVVKSPSEGGPASPVDAGTPQGREASAPVAPKAAGPPPPTKPEVLEGEPTPHEGAAPEPHKAVPDSVPAKDAAPDEKPAVPASDDGAK